MYKEKSKANLVNGWLCKWLGCYKLTSFTAQEYDLIYFWNYRPEVLSCI